MDAEFYEYIDLNMKKIFAFDENVLQYMTKMNCSIKGKIVELDERESDLRAILNFGHTVGHAIESVSNFSLLHGECVSIGIAAACKLAQSMEMIDGRTTAKILATLQKAGLPVKAEGLEVEQIYLQMFQDKKVKKNKLTFVLPRGIGEAIQCVVDNEELVKKAIAGVV